ncbi:MAG: NADH-quinone oxidoreductase subunit L [Cytophagaceae bacterium]|jgi:NADH-quinone oxidoreductase subunit L|nr:NADH-quinone oxidoreductase subunit L [Cytophagaceae bacterium]
MKDFVWLIPTLPLAGFLILSLFKSFIPKGLSGYLATLAVVSSFIVVLNWFIPALRGELTPFTWVAWDWINLGKYHLNFAFQIDVLSIWFMAIITGIGSLIHLYSIAYMHDDDGITRYFSYLNLFIFSMLILVMGSNFVVLFAGWEGVGLCSYLLIGFWFKNNAYNDAAKKAFIMNRIGDLGFLLGMLLLFMHVGSLDYTTVLEQAPQVFHKNAGLITVITLLLFVGATGKSAQVPLYTWLPDAMAGPTPVSALIHAATMVTAGIYMITRTNILFDLAPITLDIVYYIGTATAILAALIGLTQNDIKKVLAYSTVSQLGFMFMALGMGAYSIAVFHVTTHAFFKALLFLGSGSVIHAMGGEQDIRYMGGLRHKLPITFITFLIGTLAIAGIPPLAGFFSKDAILAVAFEHSPIYWGIGVFAALLTTFYMFRMFFLTFFGSFRGSDKQKEHLHESPLLMTLPLAVLALLSFGGGFINIPHVFGGHQWFSHYLNQKSLVPLLGESSISVTTEYILMAIALILVMATILFTYISYVKKHNIPSADNSESTTLGYKLSYNKFYIDEIYHSIIVKPLHIASDTVFSFIEKYILDGIVKSIGLGVQKAGSGIRHIQSGSTNTYALFMILGVALVILIQIVL